MTQSSTNLSRRGFVVATTAWLAACNSSEPLEALERIEQAAQPPEPGRGYGPLLEAIDETTGLPLLKLPEGFRYLSFGWQKDPMADGTPTPARHDGMGVVSAQGNLIKLVRNHEIVSESGAFVPGSHCYDPVTGGGATTLLFDTEAGKLVKAWPSLAGTLHNCAGGVTPWGTWLTCEELVCGPGEAWPPYLLGAVQKNHGYVFEVHPDDLNKAVPITDMGRFRHEAVAVDERTGTLYLTEDHSRTRMAGFYRFLPNQAGVLSAGGKLQAISVAGPLDLRRDVPVGAWVDTHWVDIEDPDRGHAPGTRNMHGVLSQGVDAGCAVFTRLEGCWACADGIYFVSTDGGNAACGQVFLYDPENERLKLVYQSPGQSVLDGPDNIAQSPRGGLVMCEDGGRTGQLICALGRDGNVFNFAQNNVILNGQVNGFSGDFRSKEWAGVTYSPDGKWMFANVQTPGITFAITGPWQDGLV